MSDFSGPQDLAESIGRGGHRCAIPLTHDRLEECHYWWHEMARNYHEPNPFRWTVGAFLQAARSVTFMLQSERKAFSVLDWYDAWVEQARDDPVLRWVNEARVHVVHVGVLAPSSWVELRCLFPPGDIRREFDDEEDARSSAYHINPFVCTHELMKPYLGDDHPHDVVRHWELSDIPEREVLDLCADVFGALSELSTTAHAAVGQTIVQMDGEEQVSGGGGRFGCMKDLDQYRIAHFEMSVGRGVQAWTNEPPNLH